MDLQLNNAAVFISGGTKGMGYATAIRYAEEGARVCVTGREQAAIDKTVADMQAAGSPDALGMSMDLYDPQQIEDTFKKINDRWGELNTLINVTGVADSPGDIDFTEISEENWRAALDIGLMSAVRCCRAALPLIRKADWGRIINVSTLAARMSSPAYFSYGVSKAALQNFTKTLAQALGPEEILVNLISPGAIHTPTMDVWMDATNAEERGFVKGDLKSVHGWLKSTFESGGAAGWIGRVADKSEIAPLMALMGSPLNSYITGADINVDGGTPYLS